MKVEKQHIENLLSQLEFKFARVENTTVTGCWAFLPNGFQVAYGESACVDPADYKWEDGCKYAKENCLQEAVNKLWELEGYLLKVTGQTSDQFERASEAFAELKELKSAKPHATDALQYRTSAWAEVKCDVYSGDNCDEHRPYIEATCEGDMDSEVMDEITFSSQRWPVGTKIKVEVPCCPDCHLDVEFKGDDGKCECGFDWVEWVEHKYS
ncbi:Gp49 family protein [Vibrio cholerae]